MSNNKLNCEEWIEAGIDPSFLNYHLLFKKGVHACEKCPFNKECPVQIKDYDEKIDKIEKITGKIVYLRCPIYLIDEFEEEKGDEH